MFVYKKIIIPKSFLAHAEVTQDLDMDRRVSAEVLSVEESSQLWGHMNNFSNTEVMPPSVPQVQFF